MDFPLILLRTIVENFLLPSHSVNCNRRKGKGRHKKKEIAVPNVLGVLDQSSLFPEGILSGGAVLDTLFFMVNKMAALFADFKHTEYI